MEAEAPCKEGDRIRLVEMPDDPCPIPEGSEGTVDRFVKLWGNEIQIGVKWDSGRTLSLIHPKDKFTVLPVPNPKS